MLVALRPTYTMRVTVQDRAAGGAFQPLAGETGCDQILKRVQKALTAEFNDTAFTLDVWFEQFEHRQ